MRQFRVLVNGNEYKVAIEELQEEGSRPAAPVSPPPRPAVAQAAPAQPQAVVSKPAAGSTAPGNIVAAMPGTILDVHVSEGDTVTRGQSLLVLEAMKMENDIMAPSDGVVKAINVTKGASVNSGDLLMVIS